RRMVLVDDLEVQANGPWRHPLQPPQLVGSGLPHLVGDVKPPARVGQLHAGLAPRRSVRGRALARLTWSLPPHSPAGMIAATEIGLRILSLPGQGLHLNRAMLDDQRSSYVGRFARGWRRLPGRFPGQP